MTATEPRRRAVVTGVGMVSPLGLDPQTVWESLRDGRSGIRSLTAIPVERLPTRSGGQAWDFSGAIEDFGPLEKNLQRAIKKGLKLMCREIQMGVAAAQRAIADSRLDWPALDRDRIGTMFGSDYIMTIPEEYARGIRACLNGSGRFDFARWADTGLKEVDPLWLLKYLPNMPASHVAIYNDCRGPSNSLTMREASSNLSLAEAAATIARGAADVVIAGATGTRIHPLRSLHVCLQEQVAPGSDQPQRDCRPFEAQRQGMVLGEGAGCVILESLAHAEARSATIYGEVIGQAVAAVLDERGAADYERAFAATLVEVMARSRLRPADVGHVHAHGLATTTCDRADARAIHSAFQGRAVPVTAAKSYMGNLGGGSGMVEFIASLLALKADHLFPILNLDTVDRDCPIAAVREARSPGRSFINLNITPTGQAAAVAVRAMP